MEMNNNQTPAPSSSSEERESELGLSLGLQSNDNTNQQEREEEDDDHDHEVMNKELNLTRFGPTQSKLQKSDFGGITTGHVNSPPNRKARVSVRARCEAATVSLNLHFFYIIFRKLFFSSIIFIHLFCSR